MWVISKKSYTTGRAAANSPIEPFKRPFCLFRILRLTPYEAPHRVFSMSEHDCAPAAPFDRRTFLTRSAAGFSAAWLTANWPSMVSAATHAHAAVASPDPAKFEFFTPAEAAEIEAMSSRIIPTDETPGAKEAGVVYF